MSSLDGISGIVMSEGEVDFRSDTWLGVGIRDTTYCAVVSTSSRTQVWDIGTLC